MRVLVGFVCFLGAYWISALLLCGDFMAPFYDALMAPAGANRVWHIFFVGGFFAAFLIASPLVTPRPPGTFRPALFIAAWMWLAALSAGFYGDWVRRQAIADFHADRQIQDSFFISLHQVPNEFQFYIHAAVLKHCVPYIWSYRRLAFFPLGANTAVNVLPQEWLTECGIKRS